MPVKFKSEVSLDALNNATVDTDKFLVADSGIVKYRTGTQLLSDLGITIGVANDVQNQVKAGVAINKGQAVYVTGADGTNIIVGLASNTSEATSSKTLGLLDATVAINGFANVVEIGRLAGLNTIGANTGDPVWLGVNGNLIYGLANKPYAPAHLVFIGIVTRVNANNGEIFVNVQNGFELKEIHDVDIITNVPINGDVLGYDGTLWVNKTIAEWLGYTPAPASGSANYIQNQNASAQSANMWISGSAYIDSNVGIGTSSPAQKFDVDGLSYFRNDIYMQTNKGIFFSGNSAYGAGVYGQNSGNDLVINANGSEKMRVTSVGSVGIGTSSPGEKLTVSGGSVGISIDGTTAARTYYNRNGSYIWSTGLRAGDTKFHIFDERSADRLVIDDSGNVGIGTTSPTSKLEVFDGDVSVTTSGSFSFFNSNRNFIPNTGGVSLGALRFRGYSTGTTYQVGSAIYSFSQDAWTSTSAPGYLSFQTTTAGSTSPSEKMVISSAGAVKFNSYGSGTFTGTATQKLAVDSSGNIIEIPIGAGPVDGSGTTNYVTKWTDADTIGNSIMYDNGTNVGIGTATTSGRLTLSNPISDGSIPLISIRDTSNVYEVGYLSFSQSTDIMTLMNKQSYSSSGIVFGTNNAEKMRITVAGNVGIGTSSPLTKLHVAGGYLRLESSGDKQLDFVGSGKNTYSIEHDTARIYFYNGSTGGVPLAILNGGNVGIGTANPATRFQVSESGSAFYVGNAYAKVENTAGSSSTFYLADTTDSAALKNIGSSLAFINSSSESMRLTTTGLGIGTTSPNYKLDVNGTVNIVGTFGNRGVEGAYRLKLADNGGTANDSGIGMDGYAGGGEQMWFNSLDGFYWATGTYGEKMRITQAGNVGIGTSAPNFKLEVNGSVHVGNSSASASGYSNAMEIVNTASSPTSLFLYQLGVGSGHIGLRSNDSNLYIVNSYTDGSITNPSAITLTPSGNVGIGTSSPNEKLEVLGAIRLTRTDDTAQFCTIQSTSASGFLSTSFRPYAGAGLYGEYRFDAKDSTGGTITPLYINTLGNIGIGTTSQVVKLQVNGTITSTGALTAYTSVPSINIGHNGDSAFIASTSGDGANTPISFSVGNNAEKMRITASGNVGIGTSSPGAKLHIGGGELRVDAGQAITLDIANNMYLVGASNQLRLYNGGNPVVNITTGGNVGIGTTSPSQKLDVVGAGKFSSSVQVGDDSTTASAANVGATRYRSDANNSYMDMVMQTGASTYAWVNVVQNNW